MKIKSSILKICLISILILCNISCLFLLIQERKLYKKEIVRLGVKFSNKSEQYEIINEDRFLAYLNEGCVVSDELKIINQAGDKIKLSSYTNKKKCLVFRSSFLNCQPCVDEAVLSLKKIIKDVDSSQVIILANYRLLSDLKKFKRINKMFNEVYQVDSLNLPLEELNIPYFFMIDEDMKTNHVFVPQKELSVATDRYLSIVKKLLQNNNTK